VRSTSRDYRFCSAIVSTISRTSQKAEQASDKLFGTLTLGQTNANTDTSNWDIQKQTYFVPLDSVAGKLSARWAPNSRRLY